MMYFYRSYGILNESACLEEWKVKKEILQIRNEIGKVIRGKDEIILNVLKAVLAGGHILLEDIPGVGKTTLAVTLSKTMDLDYHRVQFTPDVLPSDITGFSMYNAANGEFEYRPGAALCNLFLADEINRTSPKTQSALLEIMEEGRVTVDGVTHEIPSPFIVIATENPLGSSGTQRMPESQMDRFLVRLSMGYPDHASAIEILKGSGSSAMEHVENVINAEDLMKLRRETAEIYIQDDIYDFIVRLTEETRKSANLSLGLSPRGSLAMMRMARANAMVNERDFVSAEDVLKNFKEIAAHRVVLSPRARTQGMKEEAVLEDIMYMVKAPGV